MRRRNPAKQVHFLDSELTLPQTAKWMQMSQSEVLKNSGRFNYIPVRWVNGERRWNPRQVIMRGAKNAGAKPSVLAKMRESMSAVIRERK